MLVSTKWPTASGLDLGFGVMGQQSVAARVIGKLHHADVHKLDDLVDDVVAMLTVVDVAGNVIAAEIWRLTQRAVATACTSPTHAESGV